MKVALAAVGFITNDTEYNKNKMIEVLKKYSEEADLVLFGESYLQGFECLDWNYQKDNKVALTQDSDLIRQIGFIAKEYQTAVSFGYIEKDGDKIYSSQLTLDKNGNALNNFRRVSTGWKEKIADCHYVEGKGFSQFDYLGKTFSVGLCGDLWEEQNCLALKNLNTDIILWPVYTDFNFREWNTKIKQEYSEQSFKCGDKVLYVNSYCLDGEGYEIARGGAVFFEKGKIVSEVPAGKESVLIVNV
ncbi:carbon-nitrogen hydrolase family protein [Facklamia sp. P13064]|uniref:carbon-nitrogen hydrolase family protein n=1 Tax=unclassified Facklamia TaxID=2622293 RepID=UPI003D183EE1